MTSLFHFKYLTMLDQQYNSEIEILLAQFLSAFDDCIIRRGKDENGKEKYI